MDLNAIEKLARLETLGQGMYYTLFKISLILYLLSGTGIPLLKDLCEHVTPKYATQWKTIGLLLGLSSATLQVIEHDNTFKAVACCNALLEKWIEVDPSASWNKLLRVLKLSIISGNLNISEGIEFCA